jgi:hypothetical protein
MKDVACAPPFQQVIMIFKAMPILLLVFIQLNSIFDQ